MFLNPRTDRIALGVAEIPTARGRLVARRRARLPDPLVMRCEMIVQRGVAELVDRLTARSSPNRWASSRKFMIHQGSCQVRARRLVTMVQASHA